MYIFQHVPLSEVKQVVTSKAIDVNKKLCTGACASKELPLSLVAMGTALYNMHQKNLQENVNRFGIVFYLSLRQYVYCNTF